MDGTGYPEKPRRTARVRAGISSCLSSDDGFDGEGSSGGWDRPRGQLLASPPHSPLLQIPSDVAFGACLSLCCASWLAQPPAGPQLSLAGAPMFKGRGAGGGWSWLQCQQIQCAAVSALGLENGRDSGPSSSDGFSWLRTEPPNPQKASRQGVRWM